MPFKPLHIPDHLYFITNVTIAKLAIFKDPSYATIILSSLDWHRKEKRIRLFAYVLMPTHLHWICQPLDPFTVNEIHRSFASFTAHAILKKLRSDQHIDWLNVFASYAKSGKQHQIWQEPLAENVFSTVFLEEKMEYIHNNPVTKGWRLVADRSEFRYSSACFYDRGVTPVIEVDDIRDLLV
jgi:putative transposase